MHHPSPANAARVGAPNTLVRALGYLGRYRKLALVAYVSLTVSSFGALIVPSSRARSLTRAFPPGMNR